MAKQRFDEICSIGRPISVSIMFKISFIFGEKRWIIKFSSKKRVAISVLEMKLDKSEFTSDNSVILISSSELTVFNSSFKD